MSSHAAGLVTDPHQRVALGCARARLMFGRRTVFVLACVMWRAVVTKDCDSHESKVVPAAGRSQMLAQQAVRSSAPGRADHCIACGRALGCDNGTRTHSASLERSGHA
jgi:hypothetical protein